MSLAINRDAVNVTLAISLPPGDSWLSAAGSQSRRYSNGISNLKIADKKEHGSRSHRARSWEYAVILLVLTTVSSLGVHIPIPPVSPPSQAA